MNGISASGWRQLAAWTGYGTLGCVAISVAINFVVFADIGGEALRRSIVSATLIPIALAGPLFFYLTLKLRELAVVNHQLADAATTDRLTMCLNRGAFASAVEAFSGLRQGHVVQGALLVVDADHFKSVNDRFGHDQGDEALQIIASAIRSQVRAGDLFGRLGGEEFGVFLPAADASQAALVAERIREEVKATPFRPNGFDHFLTVSVGGAAFSPIQGFADMFKAADRNLYHAKNTGRDRVAVIGSGCATDDSLLFSLAPCLPDICPAAPSATHGRRVTL